MDMAMIINQMLVLFIVMLLGYLVKKVKILDNEGDKKLSVLLLNVTLPALTLAAVMEGEKTLSNREVLLLFGLAALMYALFIALSFVIPKILRVPKEDVGLYRFMTIFSNIGFMGFPVVRAIFGSEAVFYAAIFNMPFNLLSFSLGVRLITGGKGKGVFDLRFLLHPGIISSFLSVILYLVNPPYPAIISETFTLVGDVTVPMSMLITGSSLANIPLKKVFSDVRIYVFSVTKLLIIPPVFWAALRLFVDNPVILGVSVVMASMPVATAASMFCNAYGGNMELSSKGIFISTLLSVATIPFLMWLLFVRA